MNQSQVFHNFALFDGVSPQLQPGCWLEVADGRIRSIGAGARSLPEGAVLGSAEYGLTSADILIESPQPFRAVFNTFHFPGYLGPRYFISWSSETKP